MNWLILLYFIELGYAPYYQSINILPGSHKFIVNESIMYVTFDTEVVLFKHIFIGGSSKIFMQPKKNSYQFYPIENDFLFRAGLRFENIEAGFRHQCNHPIYNCGVQSQGKSYGGFEEFYIRITNR